MFCAALVGARLPSAWFNTYPAQVSWATSARWRWAPRWGTIAVIVRQEIVLFIMGGVFVMETLSVMIQVASFADRTPRLPYGADPSPFRT